jgi:hypothetical protein
VRVGRHRECTRQVAAGAAVGAGGRGQARRRAR